MTIRGTTGVIGVFGWPVKHSASPAMHNAAFLAAGLDLVYVPFPVDPARLDLAVAGVRGLGLLGANVTVPHKERVGEFLDFLTPRAERLGAVNTLFFDGERLGGDSTDGVGFLAALRHDDFAVDASTRAVVLGAGGSARAVVDALVREGARVIVANRTSEKARGVAETFGAAGAVAMEESSLRDALFDATLLVNTTSVGLAPRFDDMPPVPRDALRPSLFVTDLIYNPAQTRLLKMASDAGCRTQNGIEMLVRQGAESFARWTNLAPDIDTMRDAVQAHLTK